MREFRSSFKNKEERRERFNSYEKHKMADLYNI